MLLLLLLLSPHPKVGRPLYSSRTYTRRLQLQSTPIPTSRRSICGGGGSQRGASHRSCPDHSAGRRSLVAAPLTPTRGRGATSLSTPPFNAVSETGGRKEPWPRILRGPRPPPPVRIAKAGRRQARYHAGPAASRGRPSRGLSRRDKCRPSSGRDTRRSAAGPRVATPRGRPQKGSRGLRRGPPPSVSPHSQTALMAPRLSLLVASVGHPGRLPARSPHTPTLTTRPGAQATTTPQVAES
jgi:hypothetical protein